jgi:hypothetical protein
MFNRKPLLAGASCLHCEPKHDFPRVCPSTKTHIYYSFLKKQGWNLEHRLLTPRGSHRNCIDLLDFIISLYLFPCISLDCILPYLLYYSLLHYFNISTNVKVFSFQWYQLYAYPGNRAWATGSLLWARQPGWYWGKKTLALTSSHTAAHLAGCHRILWHVI